MKLYPAIGVSTAAIGVLALSGWSIQEHEFAKDFALSDCTFSATGRTPYWVLEPGHTLTLEGKATHLVITVLDQTQIVAGIETRVIEERESENGKLVEVSRNFFAICRENSSVFYFGEDVDIYKEGRIVGHEGAWRHGSAGARAGLMMPGLPLPGARYHQEVAPGVAMDRAEIIDVGAHLRTPYGSLDRVVTTRESSPLEPGTSEVKAYAPGIGIVRDADLYLTLVKPAKK